MDDDIRQRPTYPISSSNEPSAQVSLPILLNIFSSETTGPIKVKFHMELLWDGGMKVCSNVPGHMTKMAAIYGKNLKNSSSLEPKGNDLETWYATLGAQVLPSLLK